MFARTSLSYQREEKVRAVRKYATGVGMKSKSSTAVTAIMVWK